MQCRMRAGCDYRRALSGASVDAYGRVAYMCMLYTPDGCVHGCVCGLVVADGHGSVLHPHRTDVRCIVD